MAVPALEWYCAPHTRRKLGPGGRRDDASLVERSVIRWVYLALSLRWSKAASSHKWGADGSMRHLSDRIHGLGAKIDAKRYDTLSRPSTLLLRKLSGCSDFSSVGSSGPALGRGG
jgi:hypothetical protein